eukprot:gene5264-7315_t
MSGWKLVEAVAEPSTDELNTSNTSSNNGNKNGTNTGFKGRGGNNGGGRGRGRGSYSNRNGRGYGHGGRGKAGFNNNYILSQADRAYLAFMAVQQIEILFIPDNLCMDTFLRSYMDVEGYVPIALVYGYPNVACFGAPYPDLIGRLQETTQAENSILEFDYQNETIRVKIGWDMWLMPNQFGGRGVPRYIKQPVMFANDPNLIDQNQNNNVTDTSDFISDENISQTDNDPNDDDLNKNRLNDAVQAVSTIVEEVLVGAVENLELSNQSVNSNPAV